MAFLLIEKAPLQVRIGLALRGMKKVEDRTKRTKRARFLPVGSMAAALRKYIPGETSLGRVSIPDGLFVL